MLFHPGPADPDPGCQENTKTYIDMKTSRILTVALLGACIGLLSSCTANSLLGMAVPAPNAKPSSGEIPSGDPFNPDEPTPEPVDPTDPYDAIINNPERLARIGITPIIEIYYTEYTKENLFPSIDEVRNLPISMWATSAL